MNLTGASARPDINRVPRARGDEPVREVYQSK